MSRIEPASLSARIAAKPAAPASITDIQFWASTPPMATTGKGAADRQISFSTSTPTESLFPGVSKTGPNTAKSAPPLAAACTCSTECVDTPMMNPGGTTFRTTSADSERAVNWTPSQPAAIAMSKRSLIKTRVEDPRVNAETSRASSYTSRAGSNFSRNCTSVTPASTAAWTMSNISRRFSVKFSGVASPFVMR